MKIRFLNTTCPGKQDSKEEISGWPIMSVRAITNRDKKVLLPSARKFDALVDTGLSLALPSHLLQGQPLVEPGFG